MDNNSINTRIDKENETIIRCIVTKYFFIIRQYLILLNDSLIIQQLDNVDNITQIGLNAITHIFKINLFFYKNVDIAFFYAQKAYYCYLEYIEQINIKCITDDLNIKDAVLFIYNKTLSKYDISSINIQDLSLSVDNNVIEPMLINIENFDIIKHAFPEINNIVYFVLNFDNNNITLTNRVNICEKYLLNYLLYCIINRTNGDFFECLKVFNEKINFDNETYCLFLEELIKYIGNEKNVDIEINQLFLYQCYNDNFKLNNYTKNEMRQLIKHLF